MSFDRPINRGILILDFGSQYTFLIARRLRELGAYTEIISGTTQSPPGDFDFLGIILSGGPDSIHDEKARVLPPWVLASDKPILGICYGMQLLAQNFQGKIHAKSAGEYGKAILNLKSDSHQNAKLLFHNIPSQQQVWMSHQDAVIEMPDGYAVIGRTDKDVIAAISHISKPYFGLQFHPEVHHSTHGTFLLKNFVTKICNMELTWQSESMVEVALEYIKDTVKNGRVLMAVSGGVDSTVAIALMIKALGQEKVTGVFIDNGLLRKDEAFEVKSDLGDIGIKDLVVLDRREAFLADLKDVTCPEEKRKKIGLRFIAEFENFAKASSGYTHLGQGTLYPDVIESSHHGMGASVIKSHHNVGGLPEKLNLSLVEPFRFFFKDEVRQVGRSIGLPERLIARHPFPGPGLAVRILGEVDEAKIEVLKEADAIFIENLRKSNLYDKVWQAFTVFLPLKSVGVMGDNRTYRWVIALRAVTAQDGMTAGVGQLPVEFLTKVADEIVRKVAGVGRVVYDVTTKPPATIEWE